MLTSGMAVFMLSTSPFEFVIRHFCWLLLVVLCVGACNSLVVFPILLSMLGPEAELVPLEHPDRISTPSPVPMRSSKRCNKSFVVNGSRGSSRSSGSNNCHKAHHYHKDVNINDPSLTTITEEPQSWKSSNSSIQMHNDWSAPPTPPTHSHHPNHLNNHYMNNINNYQHRNEREPPHGAASSSNCSYAGPPPSYHKAAQPMPGGYGPPELQSIVVQPEVTVETTHSDSNTTKVTATANIKVELVTPGRAVRSYNFTS